MPHTLTENPDTTKPVITSLFDLISNHKWMVLTICIFSTISVALTFSPHAFAWWIGTKLIEEGSIPDTEILFTACALLFLGLAGRYILAGAASIGSHFIAFQIQRGLRQDLAEKLAAVSMGYLEAKRQGDLRKLAVDDVEALEDGFAHLIPEMAASTVNPIILITAMFVVDWRMAIFALLPILSSFVLMGYLMKRGEEATRRYQKGLSEIGAIAQETIAAFPLVKTHGAKSIVLGRADKSFKKFKEETGGWIKEALVPSVWFQVLTTSAPAAVLPVGVYFYQSGSLTMSSLLFFLIVSIGLGNVFVTLGTLSHRLASQKGILDRIFNILGEEEIPVVRKSNCSKNKETPLTNDISFENVSFEYHKGQHVLKNINLLIKSGESVALVGPSGSGKSTITRLLSRFWDISEGKILIGGKDIRQFQPEELNERISHVFQDVFLFSQSISDNIKLGRPEATEDEVVAAAKAAQAHEFIVTLPEGYQTLLSEGGRNFSGGQRQRLSIARAILRDAPLLLLDEATAYADPKSELQVQLAISELTRNKTVIAIAHRLNTIVDMDRIIVLEKGEIINQGSHIELLEKCALYQKMWEASVGNANFTFRGSASLYETQKPVQTEE